MLSIQQLLKALRKLQNNTVAGGDLVKSVKHVAVCANNSKNETNTTTIIPIGTTLMTSFKSNQNNIKDDKEELLKKTSSMTFSELSEQPQQTTEITSSGGGGGGSSNKASHSTTYSNQIHSSQLLLKQQTTQQHNNCHHASQNECFSLYSPVNADSSDIHATTTQDSVLNKASVITTNTTSPLTYLQQPQRSQRIQNFYQQQIFHQFHTQHNQNLNTKQKQTTFAMSSLAAEPLTLQKSDVHSNGKDFQDKHDDESSSTPSSSSSSSASCPDTKQQNSSTGKPCFNTGLADILQFMELIGNLKHTKRTGWVLRDVNDCESISGHMYRMSMLTFLLDGSEGLNQIKCMELALVHDLAESLVGDITPFCGITKEEKKNMELKAMEDICKLIEPRGKRIMELFEEYEHGESAESKFVKDLDRLDMVMQAFEYEKRDDCLLKHQEFFDSTEGKFNHPFVKKLVNEIYEQRDRLAKAKGAVPPPKIEVPNMDEPIEKTTTNNNKTNGHCANSEALEKTNETSKSS